MLAVTRHEVPEADDASFRERAAEMLDALSACTGYVNGRVGRALDDPAAWVIITEWENVGAYRRALSSFDVRVRAVPLLATARDEPSAFEVLLDGETGSRPSDRAS
ncbi:MAG: antibiotic biosynthesis monooxygenase [Streptosporangiales bacterium]|nr:antibiotic biosynthesis monooxygenase [Streptosporangiales bacterium]